MVPNCLQRKPASFNRERPAVHCRNQAARWSRKEQHLHVTQRRYRIHAPSEFQRVFSRSATSDDSASTSSSAPNSNGQVPTTANTATLDAPPSSSPSPSSSDAPNTTPSTTSDIEARTTTSSSASSTTTSSSSGSNPDALQTNGTSEAPVPQEGSKFELNTGVLASAGFVGGLVALVGLGAVFREPIKAFLEFFVYAVDQWGPLGYVAYGIVYTGLEVLAVPAIPLTMTAGVIFGPTTGTLIVSLSATSAATIAFLIARYVARERVMEFAKNNRKFAAIDAAIGKDSLKVVTLLRLSPLLPLAISNYLYGLTSVDLTSYVLGSFLGMLPGTYAYVSAGHLGKAVLTEGEGMLSVEAWQVGVGIAATVLAVGFIGRLAKNALDDVAPEVDGK